MQRGREILSTERFKVTLQRLARQVIESYAETGNLCIIGIQEKGVVLAERLIDIINSINELEFLKYGKLDITFYRDDFRIRKTPLKANATEIEFQIEGQNILLVDDVLYTGRTIQAAMSALQDFGRPDKIELLTMVDRRFNRHLPIKADYVGIEVDSVDQAYVQVKWEHVDGKDQILIFSAAKTETTK